MLERRTPLRRTGIARSGRALQRRKRINDVSAKKASSSREYRKVRRWVADRANGLCEAQVHGVCTTRGVHAHHVLRRSQGGPDEPSNLLWLCAECHDWTHSNPEESYKRGLLRRPSGRCIGSGEEPPTCRPIYQEKAGCLVCGHHVGLVFSTDGTGRTLLTDHNYDGSVL